MNTDKLFYKDAYIRRFAAKVLTCRPVGGLWDVTLDATAFFPEGGGQTGDTGTLGDAAVVDTQEKKGTVLHRVDKSLTPGQVVQGEICWQERFRKMQTHSGEHIISGLVRRHFGYANVGFHLGEDGCTIDYDGELTRSQLNELEDEANAVVWDNRGVRAYFPSQAELAELDYRSKLDLKENVRIVTVDGVDVCACCAPHVRRTGEIGAIKLLDFMRHRGGVRIWAKCGSDALRDYRARYTAAADISGLLNVPQENVAEGVEKLSARLDIATGRIVAMQRQMAALRAEAIAPTDGNIVLFGEESDGEMRSLANAGMEKCGGVCAVFSGEDGAYRFVMGSNTLDMRDFIKQLAEPLNMRGGGQPRMVSGRCNAAKAEIEAYFRTQQNA